MDDVVPRLLEAIETQFEERTYNSTKLKKALKLLKDKKASYLNANDFASEVGEILADVLKENITPGLLPDEKMYFNIADRILNPTMKKNHELISNYTADVQTELNKEANLRLKAQIPEFNQNRVDGIINRLASAPDFESVKWLLDDPIINFSQSIVDDSIKANAHFHAKSGLQPKIVRRVSGHACDWCRNLAGSYDYYSAPDDIYKRHQRCRCTVDYRPDDGRRQDVWSKQWKDPDKETKLEARKNIGLKSSRILHQEGPPSNNNHLSVKQISDVDWFKEIDGMTPKGSRSLNVANQEINEYMRKTGNEMMAIVDKVSGKVIAKKIGLSDQVDFDDATVVALKSAVKSSLVLSHNHPGLNSNFSRADIATFLEYSSIQALTLQTTDGSQYLLDRNGKNPNFLKKISLFSAYEKEIERFTQKYGENDEYWGIITEKAVESVAKKYGFVFRRV